MVEKIRHKRERLAQKAQGWYTQWSKSTSRERPIPKLDEERLLVLKMLAEGKINLEQAEALLETLDQ